MQDCTSTAFQGKIKLMDLAATLISRPTNQPYQAAEEDPLVLRSDPHYVLQSLGAIFYIFLLLSTVTSGSLIRVRSKYMHLRRTPPNPLNTGVRLLWICRYPHLSCLNHLHLTPITDAVKFDSRHSTTDVFNWALHQASIGVLRCFCRGSIRQIIDPSMTAT